VSPLHQNFFHGILYKFNRRDLATAVILYIGSDLLCKGESRLIVPSAANLCRLEDGVCDFFNVEGDFPAVSFPDLGNHLLRPFLPEGGQLECLNFIQKMVGNYTKKYSLLR